ncbi:serine/threonine-protein kinase D6PK [Forsythia ovata]|uniref:Serine/threonine-protein kinase D6PK n=1 Tax=Forsythia ovata TaxID=205694 RepID=A0ABD1VHC7_9LAMI
MERVHKAKPLPKELPTMTKVTNAQPSLLREEIRNPSTERDLRDMDSAALVRRWRGKNALTDNEELIPDIVSFKVSGDSFEESGSISFHGVSHPPEPIDKDLMRPLYVPIGQSNGDGKCFAKSLSIKGPFLEDLSMRLPNIKPSPSLLSPAESLVEEPNDIAAVSSAFSGSLSIAKY